MMDSREEIAILRDFSSSDNSSEWEVSNHSVKYILSTDGFFDARFLFYADGNCEENKGYISIIRSGVFPVLEKLLDDIQVIEIRFFFSVLDISKNKRFVLIPGKPVPRDSKKNFGEIFHFGLERYLKRSILLNDPPELLPGDCLTILVEMEYTDLSFIPKDPEVDFVKVFELNDNRIELHIYNSILIEYCIQEFSFSRDRFDRLCIPLDTFYGRKLCSLSKFFQRAADTPMTQGTNRRVHIPNDELVAFTNIFRILFKPTTVLVIDSIKHICQLYVIAEKYDFQSFFQTCRQLIKAFLRNTADSGVREHAAQSVPNIIELADEYRDNDLKDTINTYLESKEKFGINHYDLGKYLKKRIFSDWKCVSRIVSRNLSNDKYQFRFTRITNPVFEFYL